MEDTVLVIMLKDKKSGFLEQELGSCHIEKHEDLLVNLFAQKEDEDGTIALHIRLCCNRELDDDSFNTVYDYYDMSVYSQIVRSAQELEGYYDPTWEVVVTFDEDEKRMSHLIQDVLSRHFQELASVFKLMEEDG